MKNQYFGDENDYKKYGLINALTGRGTLSAAICWMLTPNDHGPDGRFTGYLSQPEKWCDHDPTLYDRLRQALLVQERREVGVAAETDLLPGARYYDPLLPDDEAGRKDYWRAFWDVARGCDLVFFDPDNGMEVQSKPYGRKGSSKYLYWHELIETVQEGYSALVYQHFPRVRRGPFIDQMACEMHARTNLDLVYSFRTSRVVFFLLPRAVHLAAFERRVPQVERAWAGQIEVRRHAYP